MLPVYAAAITVFLLTVWNDSTISRNHKQVTPLINELVHAPCVPSDANDGKIVYITCELDGNSTFYAPKEFSSNIYSYSGAFFETKVEMFQWISMPGFFGVYKVGKFVDHIVDNSTLGVSLFKEYKNPVFFPHVPGAGRKFAPRLKVGGYTVPKGAFVASTKRYQLNLIDDRWYQPSALTYPLPVAEISNLNTQVYENGLYTGDPLAPKIGDLRVTFWGNESVKFSVIGRQKSGILHREYSIEPISLLDHNLILLAEDIASPKALTAQFLRQYETTPSVSWILRFSSLILMAASVYMHYHGLRAPKSDTTLLICSLSASATLLCFCECIIWATCIWYVSVLLALLAIGTCTITVSTWKIDPMAINYKLTESSYIGLRGPYDSVRWSTASPTASIAMSSDQPLMSARNM